MYCNKCGHLNTEQAKFCKNCGEKIELSFNENEVTNSVTANTNKTDFKKSLYVNMYKVFGFLSSIVGLIVLGVINYIGIYGFEGQSRLFAYHLGQTLDFLIIAFIVTLFIKRKYTWNGKQLLAIILVLTYLFHAGTEFSLGFYNGITRQSNTQSVNWANLTSTNENFKIAFPTTPKKSDSRGVTKGGFPIDTTLYLSEPTQDEAFILSVTTYPDTMDVSDSKTVLTQDAHNISDGKLLSFHISTFKGYPSADSLILYNDSLYGENKLVLIGHTLYGFYNTESSNSFQDFDRFVNSFQYTGK